MVLVVIGIPCAGKTTIGQHLAVNYDFTHLESSSVLPVAAAKYGYEHPEKTELASTLFTSEGYGAVEEHAVSNGMVPVRGRTVYTGVRTVEGVAVLLDYARPWDIPCFVLLVDVGMKLAIERSVKRAREAHVSAASYHERLRSEQEFGALSYARTMADWRIANTKSLESLLRRVDAVLIALANGRTRRDDSLWTKLVAAGPAGDLDMPVAQPGWLATHHPTLVNGNVLSSRGGALYRIHRLRWSN